MLMEEFKKSFLKLDSTQCGTALLVQFLHSVLFYGVRNKTEHSRGFEVCYKQILNHV